MTIAELEQQLSSFDASERRTALIELARRVDSGEIAVPHAKPEVNIHFHTFFSFNAEGWSPSRIAWESKKYGLEVAGKVEFDVLDGMEEFLEAGDILKLKTVVGMESRVFVKEYADRVLNSPNEPGIHYFMAQGCYKRPHAGSKADATLQNMARMARERNIGVMQRVNAHLGDAVLDYDRDVMPLTPSGNATERHLLLAYDKKAVNVHGNGWSAAFWAGVLGMAEPEARELIANTPAFHEKMRGKLMKIGGVGYVKPESGSFPSVEEVTEMIIAIGAIPTTTWLDGTNAGEDDMMENLELFTSKGIAAINIVPDRNWNIKNADEKTLKLKKLREVMEAARAFALPLSVGTEMNKAGLPFVDNFSAPELSDYVDEFVSGAQFFCGHTFLARFADFGYYSNAAKATFGDDRRAKNEFYTKVGKSAKPSQALYDRLRESAGQWEPEEILARLAITAD